MELIKYADKFYSTEVGYNRITEISKIPEVSMIYINNLKKYYNYVCEYIKNNGHCKMFEALKYASMNTNLRGGDFVEVDKNIIFSINHKNDMLMSKLDKLNDYQKFNFYTIKLYTEKELNFNPEFTPEIIKHKKDVVPEIPQKITKPVISPEIPKEFKPVFKHSSLISKETLPEIIVNVEFKAELPTEIKQKSKKQKKIIPEEVKQPVLTGWNLMAIKGKQKEEAENAEKEKQELIKSIEEKKKEDEQFVFIPKFNKSSPKKKIIEDTEDTEYNNFNHIEENNDTEEIIDDINIYGKKKYDYY